MQLAGRYTSADDLVLLARNHEMATAVWCLMPLVLAVLAQAQAGTQSGLV